VYTATEQQVNKILKYLLTQHFSNLSSVVLTPVINI